MKDIEIKVIECLKPIIEKLGYELYDVIYERQGTDNCLQIFIDKQDGISLNDCENVNNAITEILDDKNFIKDAYLLEVSSTGIEKRIRTDDHLKKFIENEVEVHTFKPINGNKKIKGILKEFNSEKIVIQIDDKKGIDKRVTFNKRKKKNSKKDANKKIDQKNKKVEENNIIEEDNNEQPKNETEKYENVVIEKNNISNMKTIYNWEEK